MGTAETIEDQSFLHPPPQDEQQIKRVLTFDKLSESKPNYNIYKLNIDR